jgi:hypothetical protein
MTTLPENFQQQTAQFLQALTEWKSNLPTIAWADQIADAQLGRVALFSIDMLNGFCHEGALDDTVPRRGRSSRTCGSRRKSA